MIPFVPRPRCEIKPFRFTGINRQAVRRIASLRHWKPAPLLRSVRGLVDRSIALRSQASIFRTTRPQHVECPLTIPHSSPGKGFLLGDASVFQLPTLASGNALVYPAPEGGNVE